MKQFLPICAYAQPAEGIDQVNGRVLVGMAPGNK